MRRRQAGYSLIEVLVALAVAAAVMTALSDVMALSGRMQARAMQESETREAMGGISRVVTALIHGLPVEAPQAERPSLVGTATSISVQTFGPTALGLDAFAPFELAVTETAGRSSLALTWRQRQSDQAQRETVANINGTVSFSYRRRSAGSEDWETEWRESIRLLDAVRVEIKTPNGTASHTETFPVTPWNSAACSGDNGFRSC